MLPKSALTVRVFLNDCNVSESNLCKLASSISHYRDTGCFACHQHAFLGLKEQCPTPLMVAMSFILCCCALLKMTEKRKWWPRQFALPQALAEGQNRMHTTSTLHIHHQVRLAGWPPLRPQALSVCNNNSNRLTNFVKLVY